MELGKLAAEPNKIAELATLVTAEIVFPKPNELTKEEKQLRLELEKEVAEAFYRAGKALRTIQVKKLYRDTHETVEEYAAEILGYTRGRLYQMMNAATVYENLRQNVYAPYTLFPSNEYQCRPLVRLKPKEQQEAWRSALTLSNGLSPTYNQVRQSVREIEERATEPYNPFSVDNLVQIVVRSRPDLTGKNGYYGIVTEVGKFICTVETVREKLKIRFEYLEFPKLPPEEQEIAKETIRRLIKMRQLALLLPLGEMLFCYFARNPLPEAMESELLDWLEDYFSR
jgi:hypothetical protein